MRIGRLEIRWIDRSTYRLLQDVDLRNALAVPDTAPLWKAVHQVIDQVREEAHLESENASGANEKMCAWAAAGAQHLGLFKSKLNRIRNEALKSREVARETRE